MCVSQLLYPFIQWWTQFVSISWLLSIMLRWTWVQLSFQISGFFFLANQTFEWPKCPMLLLLLSRFSRVRLCATPETAAHQAPPSLADAGKDWRREEKGTTKDEMIGWHYWLKGHEFEQAQVLVMDKEAWHATVIGPQRVRHDWEIEPNRMWIKTNCRKFLKRWE